MASKVLFVLGSGANIGRSVARKFKLGGYSVAVGSRNPKEDEASSEGFLPVKVDLSSSESISDAFSTVTKKLGAPNVVVYNAATVTIPEDQADPFGISPSAFNKDVSVNGLGVYDALHEATRGWKALGAGPKVFIMTGNILPFNSMPLLITLGAGKTIGAHLIDAGVKAYEGAGYRFYYAHQVSETGGPVSMAALNGNAHASWYWDLVAKESQGPWDVRFQSDDEGKPTAYSAK